MLEVRNLSVFYGAIHAVKSLSFSIANGAGKTTTLKTLSGLLRPRSGTIEFAGRALQRIAPHDIVRLGMVHVPEGRKIFQRLTVLENLHTGAYTRHTDAIGADLELVLTLFPRLKERRNQIAGTLSGGEQQMLAIGRALMARPRVLQIGRASWVWRRCWSRRSSR